MKKQRVIIVLFAFLFPTWIWAHGGATAIVKERMDLMDSLKAAMGELKPFFREKKAYDVNAVKNTALLIRDNAGTHMSQLFPEDTLDKPTEALPVIWKKWPKFEKLSNELETLSQNLYDVNRGIANPTEAKAASTTLFKQIAKNCSACHKQFRER
ncbi:MAG: c-type cytochrome [Cellvibrionaceae bacterium]